MTASSSTIENKKKNERFCLKCAIMLHGNTGILCDQCQSILEIEQALKQQKELETKQQQQKKQQQQPTTIIRLKEKEQKSKPVNTTSITTTITQPSAGKIGDFYYPRSLWQEIAVPIQNVEKDSNTKTVRYVVFQHNPQQPTRFIIEERDTKYYYSGSEYKRDSMYFFEASIPDLSVEKGYVITSHNNGMDGKEINLDDKNLLKKVEVKCNCYCENKKTCEHKLALVSFLKIKRLFKQHYMHTDIEKLLPGGETYAVFDSSKGKLVYTCLQHQQPEPKESDNNKGKGIRRNE